MPLSEYFIGLLIASPLIALLLFIFTGRSKSSQKFIILYLERINY